MAKADPAEDTSHLNDQIAALRADLARIAETLAALGQSTGETLGATLTEKAETLRAQGEAKLAEAEQTAEAVFEDVADYARTKPFHALALAGGLGLLLGLLLGRR